jgi:hypothetical protein
VLFRVAERNAKKPISRTAHVESNGSGDESMGREEAAQQNKSRSCVNANEFGAKGARKSSTSKPDLHNIR